MRKLIGAFPLALILFCAVAQVRADTCNGFSNNLVSNCSFETGTFSGWTGTATTAPNSGVDTLSPYVGSYEVYLGSVASTVALTQTLATTAGGSYLIEFALMNDTSPSTGYTNSFSLQFGGATLFTESAVNAGGYTLYSYMGTAGSGSSNLSFVSRNDGGSFDLDSVSVVGVTPEPSSWILLATGGAAMGGALRRRLFKLGLPCVGGY